jgi:drug/metabolite transporter (DMT)-like permease
MRTAQVLLVLSAAVFGGTWVAAPWATAEIPPLSVATIRFAIASLLLFAWCRYRGIPIHVSRADIPVILGIALTSVAGYNILFLYGVSLAPASHGAVITPGLIPAASLVIARLTLGEPIGVRRIGGVVISIGGLVLVVGPVFVGEAGSVALGDAMFATSAVLWAISAMVSRVATRRFHVAATTFLGAFVGALVLLPAMLLQPGGIGDLGAASAKAIGGVLYLATFGTVVAFVLFYEGVRRLGASRASAYTVLIPLFGVSLAVLVLGEPATPLALVGAAIVIAGLVVTQWAGQPEPAAATATDPTPAG